MTLLKTVAGVAIYVTDDGKFSAKIGRDTVTLKDLKELERRLGKTLIAADALYISYGRVRTVRITGPARRNGTDKWRDAENNLLDDYAVYAFDADALAAIKALEEEAMEAKRAYDAASTEINKRLTQVKAALIPFSQEMLAPKPQDTSPTSSDCNGPQVEP